MSLLDFVEQEEAADFMAGVIDQIGYEVPEEVREKAFKDIVNINNMHKELSEKYGTSVAGSYVATCLAVYLITIYDNGIDEIEIVPKGY